MRKSWTDAFTPPEWGNWAWWPRTAYVVTLGALLGLAGLGAALVRWAVDRLLSH